MNKLKIASVLSETEQKLFAQLDSPQKIQDFLNTLKPGDRQKITTLRTPRFALRKGRANCIEGALIAAGALCYHGQPAQLLDLRSNPYDYDHVVALFKQDNFWGAISKSNHVVLRYREPVYKSVRELVMSYFHEYFLEDGLKTLRSYSKPFSLIKYFGLTWLTAVGNQWAIAKALDRYPHQAVLTPKMIRNLRLADPIEVEAGELLESR